MSGEVKASGNHDAVRNFPLNSLRDFLLPNTLVKVILFYSKTIEQLEYEINNWINESQAVVVTVSPVVATNCKDELFAVSVTYVPAVEQ